MRVCTPCMAFLQFVSSLLSKNCWWNTTRPGFLQRKWKLRWNSTAFRLPDLRLITRRAALFTACAALMGFVGCQRTPPLEHRIPSKLAGSWTRSHLEKLPKNRVPGHAADALRARYTGASDMTVDVYRMHSQSAAFEAVQRWRPTPGKSATWKNDLFIVFLYDDPGRLREFSRAFLAHIR